MVIDETILTALGGFEEVPPSWVAATAIRPLVFEDPAIVWLEYYGEQHGFTPQMSDYDFLPFIANKGREFEAKWTSELIPEAVLVCQQPWEVKKADKVRETAKLMQEKVPALLQPALWWAPESIYGVPDVIALRSFVIQRFPELEEFLPPIDDRDDYYVVLDIKFTTKLDSTSKIRDLKNYEFQLRIYTYALGELQGYMPKYAFIAARDRIFDPLPVKVSSNTDTPFNDELAILRDQYLDIKQNGGTYTPWTHSEVKYNLSNDNEKWNKAKKKIARERVQGGDPALLFNITEKAKLTLVAQGFASLDALFGADPQDVRLEDCHGIGAKRANQIRALLGANKSKAPILPPTGLIPAQKQFEFFVDFEFFNNINVDFDTQWPGLEGKEMIFMIGVGLEADDEFQFQSFEAAEESPEGEGTLIEEFIKFLGETTGGEFLDSTKAAIYHWTAAERWQCSRTADRRSLDSDHALRQLPWIDLQKIFLDGPAALPGALAFGLKPTAAALAEFDPDYGVAWPGDLDDGLRAAVMGWQTYKKNNPLETEEMALLRDYLRTDCQALWQILRWLRSA